MQSGLFAQFGETLMSGGSATETRRELTNWSDRDLHDIGLSWSDVAYEADKAVLAGLEAAKPAPPVARDAGRLFRDRRERAHDHASA